VTKIGQTCFPNQSDRFRPDRQEKQQPRVSSQLCITRSPDPPNGLQRNFGNAWATSWRTSPSKELHRNTLNQGESQISRPTLKNSSSNENHQNQVPYLTDLGGESQPKEPRRVPTNYPHQIPKSKVPRKSLRESTKNHHQEQPRTTHPNLEEPRRIIYTCHKGSYKV
jgi:hypothetical protein